MMTANGRDDIQAYRVPIRSRALLATGIVVTIAGMLILFSVESFGKMMIPTMKEYVLTALIGVAFVMIGSSALLFAYLRGDFTRRGAIYSESYVQLGEHPPAFPVSEKEDEGDSPKEPRFIDLSPDKAIVTRFRRTRARLRDEIQNLSRRSSLNLVIGAMVTFLATGVLVYLVTREHGEFKDITSLLSFYIPRVSTVVLIETFGYFFLRLYRQNLEEIKYYQNELTTIDLLEIAWKESLDAGTADAKLIVVEQMVKSDRTSSRVPESASKNSAELSGLLEILQNVSKLIVTTAKAKD